MKSWMILLIWLGLLLLVVAFWSLAIMLDFALPLTLVLILALIMFLMNERGKSNV